MQRLAPLGNRLSLVPYVAAPPLLCGMIPNLSAPMFAPSSPERSRPLPSDALQCCVLCLLLPYQRLIRGTPLLRRAKPSIGCPTLPCNCAHVVAVFWRCSVATPTAHSALDDEHLLQDAPKGAHGPIGPQGGMEERIALSWGEIETPPEGLIERSRVMHSATGYKYSVPIARQGKPGCLSTGRPNYAASCPCDGEPNLAISLALVYVHWISLGCRFSSSK